MLRTPSVLCLVETSCENDSSCMDMDIAADSLVERASLFDVSVDVWRVISDVSVISDCHIVHLLTMSMLSSTHHVHQSVAVQSTLFSPVVSSRVRATAFSRRRQLEVVTTSSRSLVGPTRPHAASPCRRRPLRVGGRRLGRGQTGRGRRLAVAG